MNQTQKTPSIKTVKDYLFCHGEVNPNQKTNNEEGCAGENVSRQGSLSDSISRKSSFSGIISREGSLTQIITRQGSISNLLQKLKISKTEAPQFVPEEEAFLTAHESNENEKQLSPSDPEVEIGDYVVLTGCRSGIVRYIGAAEFSEEPYVIGVELDDGQHGTCDGSIDEKEYFKCSENQGVFVSKSQIENIVAGSSRRRQNLNKKNTEINRTNQKTHSRSPSSSPRIELAKGSNFLGSSLQTPANKLKKGFQKLDTYSPRDEESSDLIIIQSNMTQDCLKRFALKIKMSRRCVFLYVFLMGFNIFTVAWELLSDRNHIAIILIETFITLSLIADLLLDMFIEGENYWKDWLNIIDCVVCAFCVIALIGLVANEIHGIHGFDTYIDEVLVMFRSGFRAFRIIMFAKRGKSSHTILKQTEDVDFGAVDDEYLHSEEEEHENSHEINV